MANYSIGLDLGQARDHSALVVTERVQRIVPRVAGLDSAYEYRERPDDAYEYRGRAVLDEHHVRHIQRWALGTPYPAVVDDVAALMTEPAFEGRAQLVLDATGVGGAVADLFVAAYRAGRLGELWPRRVTLTAGFSVEKPKGGLNASTWTVHKGDLVARLVVLFERQRLKLPLGLPEAETLVRELRAFTLKQSQRTGNLRFEAARESDHDDLVIALALAVWRDHLQAEPRYFDPRGGLVEKPQVTALPAEW